MRAIDQRTLSRFAGDLADQARPEPGHQWLTVYDRCYKTLVYSLGSDEDRARLDTFTVEL